MLRKSADRQTLRHPERALPVATSLVEHHRPRSASRHRCYLRPARLTSNLYAFPAIFGGMSNWFLNPHHLLVLHVVVAGLMALVIPLLGTVALCVRHIGRAIDPDQTARRSDVIDPHAHRL
jgi:hypothetical protein